jgi:hypothetical protein
MNSTTSTWARPTRRALHTIGLGRGSAALGLAAAAAAGAEMVTTPEVLAAPRIAGAALAGLVVAVGLAVLLVGSLRRPAEATTAPSAETAEPPAEVVSTLTSDVDTDPDDDLPRFIVGLGGSYAAAS